MTEQNRICVGLRGGQPVLTTAHGWCDIDFNQASNLLADSDSIGTGGNSTCRI